jgi:2-polyprenyl-3-methyl-5-hydroxy-6-metoxy-1,4-benzoquinol methylase
MRLVLPQSDWPESWRDSQAYDLLETSDGEPRTGYALAYANRKLETIALISSVAAPGSTILDIAAAQGNYSLALAEAGYDVTWNDLRSELAGYVQLKHEHGKVRYAPGNAFELGFESEFDVVLIGEVIEHVAHPDEFLARVRMMVKPGGHVVMTTPNGAFLMNRLPKFSECADPSVFEAGQFKPDSDGHIFLLHPGEIASLAKSADLVVVKMKLFTNFLTNGFMRTGWLTRVLPRPVLMAMERLTQTASGPLKPKIHTSMAVLFRRPN